VAQARTSRPGRRTAALRIRVADLMEASSSDRKSSPASALVAEKYTILNFHSCASTKKNRFALYAVKNRDSINATITGDGSFDFWRRSRTMDRKSPSAAEMIPVHN